jgi:uncharacterized protein with GYD domain
VVFVFTYTVQTLKQHGGIYMATFFLFGTYSSDAMKNASAKRTEKAVELVKKFNGTVHSMYALLGEKDLVLIADFPGIEQAAKASLAIGKLTGIAFSTSPAIPVKDFDQLVAEI